MSKKECKRVPSYAIRHLIQSLKEKGRTCRKGAEQRIDREILICDPEEEYVRRLAEALLLKKEVTAGVRICSSPEMVQELLKIGLIKVLLISEDVPYEKRKQIFTGKRIILTRQHCVDLGEEETELRKYQPVDGLMTGILKGLQEEKFPGSCADNGNGRILGVYSPVHRIGKTTFSLKLGKALAQSEDVLYLNLETYAGMGGYFRDQDAPDLANVLYYAKQERDDIGIRIASMVKRMGDLDYIPPMKVPSIIRPSNLKGFSLLDSVKLEYVIDVVKHDLQEILGTNNLEQLIVKKLEINANKSVPSRVNADAITELMARALLKPDAQQIEHCHGVNIHEARTIKTKIIDGFKTARDSTGRYQCKFYRKASNALDVLLNKQA